jgi:hypothetical protein
VLTPPPPQFLPFPKAKNLTYSLSSTLFLLPFFNLILDAPRTGINDSNLLPL